jgi:predicted RNA-binding protein with EMAP domain
MSIWPDTPLALIAFFGSAGAFFWWLHGATKTIAEKDIEIAKTKQFSMQEVAALLDKVHKVEDSMTDLTDTVDDIKESEQDHKDHVKERLNEMKETVRELNHNIMQLLTGGGLNKPNKN